jgi:hypothetical protein
LSTTDNVTFNDVNVDGNINLSNGTQITVGTFDNSTGGNNGISLHCTVGYELNWQGGHLKSTADNGTTASDIICDSPLDFPARAGQHADRARRPDIS